MHIYVVLNTLYLRDNKSDHCLYNVFDILLFSMLFNYYFVEFRVSRPACPVPSNICFCCVNTLQYIPLLKEEKQVFDVAFICIYEGIKRPYKYALPIFIPIFFNLAI